MSPYYRIDLIGYGDFPRTLSVRRFLETHGEGVRREILDNRPKYFPFTTHGDSLRTVQGIYLSRCTENLFTAIRHALGIDQKNL